jgi:2,4-dienoyl-CoA reductase-like NADH-dependent reductase (Old Yellow Enzyme family)
MAVTPKTDIIYSDAIKIMLEPVCLGDLDLSNRFVMASLTRGRCGQSGVPDQINAEYYCQRSSFGLIISEATAISPMAEGWFGAPGIYTNAQVNGWKQVIDQVHQQGGKIVCQLWFVGRGSHSSFLPAGERVVAPSSLPIVPGSPGVRPGVTLASGVVADYEVPRELSKSEIAAIVEDWGVAAANCKLAGFDGIEIHAANGYLISTFLESCSNQRTDEYGGTFANRFRFLKEVLERVSIEFSSRRVGIKISPNNAYGGMGSPDNNELFRYVLTELNQYDLAYVQIMDQVNERMGYHGKCPVQGLDDLRKYYKGNLVANSGYTAETGGARVLEGLAEAVAYGRVSLSNPDFVERIRNGLPLANPMPPTEYYPKDLKHHQDHSIGYTDQPTANPA